MIETNLNRRLVLIITAVTLSISFLSDPSVSIRVRDLKELEKPFLSGGYTKNDQVDLVMKEMFLRKTATDGWHTIAYYVGLICAWPIGDQLGRKRGLLFSNIFRFLGITLHFVALVVSGYSNQTALAMNHTNDLVIMRENDTTNDTFTSLFISLALSSKLADGVFSGLTTVLGILYVYEVSPKTPSATKVCSLSIMAYYMFLKSAAEYIVVTILPPLQYAPVNYTTWCVSGTISIIAGLVQLILLAVFCPETPSFLAVQKGKSEEARKALVILRESEDVNDELEEIEKDEAVREFLKRSMFLVCLYLVFTLYNGFFLFMGFTHAMEIGIDLDTSVNAYLILNIVAMLIPLFFFNNLSVERMKKVMFSYYLLLGCLYFFLTILMTINLYIAPSLFQSNEFVAGLIVLVCCTTAVVYSSGPGLLTTILIMEYANQADRSKNLVLSWISGIIVTSKAVAFFALIFIKALFLYFVIFQTFPWLFLGCVTWFVWKFETVGYGVRVVELDTNANFQSDRNINKQDESSMA